MADPDRPARLLTERRALAAALLLVAAVFSALGFYYVFHKPFGPAQALALAGNLINLGVAATLALLGGSLGRAGLGRWLAGASRLAPGERAAAGLALGWGGLGLAMLALGALRLYSTPLLWAIALALLGLTWRSARAWLADCAGAMAAWPRATRLDRWATAFVVLALGLGLLRALAPPLMWDALVYHLALPRRYAALGGLQVGLADFSLFTGMPQLAEMLYTAAFLLRGGDAGAGAIAAQTLGWLAGWLLVLGLAAWVERLGASGPLAAAVLLSSFSVAAALAWAYSDLLLMLFAVAMLAMLRQWQREPAPAWLAAAGVFGGLAVSCKYTGALVPLSGAAFVLATGCAGRRPGDWARNLGWLLVTAGLVFAPWLLKNWLTTGSPVYPLWPAADMDALRLWFYNRPDLAEHNLLRAGLIGVRATFFGVQGGNDFDATLSPLLLVLPLLALAGWRGLPGAARAQLRPVAVAAGVGYLAWVALAMLNALAIQPRLFFGLLPPVAALGAAGLAAARSLDTRALRLSVFAGAAVALVLALAGLELALSFVRQNPLPYLAGDQVAADYETAHLGWHPVALARLNQLPPGSRVLFLWEARSLGCAEHLTCLPDVVIDRWWHLRRTAGQAGEVLGAWRAAGVTHVLVYDTGVEFVMDDVTSAFSPADWSELAALRARLVQVEDIGGSYSLYALP